MKEIADEAQSASRQSTMSSTWRGKAKRKLCAMKADSWAGSAKAPVRACIDRLGASAPASPRSAACWIVMLPKGYTGSRCRRVTRAHAADNQCGLRARFELGSSLPKRVTERATERAQLGLLLRSRPGESNTIGLPRGLPDLRGPHGLTASSSLRRW